MSRLFFPFVDTICLANLLYVIGLEKGGNCSSATFDRPIILSGMNKKMSRRHYNSNEDNSGNESYRNENEQSNNNILNNVSYPQWEDYDWEETTQAKIDEAVSKPILTRKMVNNAFVHLFRNKPVNLKKAKSSRKAVWQHVLEGNIKDVKQYIDEGYDICEKLPGNLTNLHVAIMSKEPEAMVKLVVDAGCNLNAVDNKNRTPLHMALSYGLNTQQAGFPRQLWSIANYLLDKGAHLYPRTSDTSTSELMAEQLDRIVLAKTGKPTITPDEERAFLKEHGIQSLNMYYGCRDLYYRLRDMEDEYLRLLHFTSLSSSTPITLLMDDRATIRTLKEYVKHWILNNGDAEVDLLVKQPGGKPDRILEVDKTIKEEGLDEDSVIKMVIRLQTYKNVWEGGRRSRRSKTRKQKKH